MATPQVVSTDQPGPASGRVLGFEDYVNLRLASARWQVKLHALMMACLQMFVWLVGLVGCLALLDAWVIPGGLGTFFRWAGGGTICLVLLWILVRRVAPVLVYRVNPLYAAQAIETQSPSLKNRLLNFLLLRGTPQGTSAEALELLKRQAATSLTHVAGEPVLDQSDLIRLGYAMVAMLAAAVGYAVLSPKNPLTTLQRVLLPWAEIAPPTRVQLEEVLPGDVAGFHGDHVTVTVKANRLRPRDVVQIHWASVHTPQEWQTATCMLVENTENTFTAKLPEGAAGLRSDLVYHITAGDAASPQYLIRVFAAPTILVERVFLDYPAYTGLVDQAVERQGDFHLIEGTRLSFTTSANQPIARAWLDFDALAPLELKPGTSQEPTAAGTLELKIPDKQAGAPFFTQYQARFETPKHELNPRPVKHSLEIVPDYPPEISLLQPREANQLLPINLPLDLEWQLRDPDFALSRAEVQVESGGKTLRSISLLDAPQSGRYVGKWTFQAKELGLEVGQTAKVKLVAQDNRTPSANRTESAVVEITLIAPPEVPNQPGADQALGQPPRPTPAEREPRQNQRPPRQPMGDRPNQEPGQPRNQQKDQPPPQDGQPNARPMDRQPNDQQPKDQNPAEENQEGQNQQGQNQQGQGQQEQNQQGEGQQGEQGKDQQGQAQSQPGQHGQGQPAAGEQTGGESSDAEREQSQHSEGQPGQSGIGSSSKPGDAANNQQKADGQQPGTGTARPEQTNRNPMGQGQPNQSQRQPGQPPEQNSGNAKDQQNSEQSSTGNSGEQSRQQQPAKHDGEAFDRLQKYFQQKEQQSQQPGESANDKQPPGQQQQEQPNADSEKDSANQSQASGNSDRNKPQPEGAQTEAGKESRDNQARQDQTSKDATSGQQPSTDSAQGESTKSGNQESAESPSQAPAPGQAAEERAGEQAAEPKPTSDKRTDKPGKNESAGNKNGTTKQAPADATGQSESAEPAPQEPVAGENANPTSEKQRRQTNNQRQDGQGQSTGQGGESQQGTAQRTPRGNGEQGDQPGETEGTGDSANSVTNPQAGKETGAGRNDENASNDDPIGGAQADTNQTGKERPQSGTQPGNPGKTKGSAEPQRNGTRTPKAKPEDGAQTPSGNGDASNNQEPNQEQPETDSSNAASNVADEQSGENPADKGQTSQQSQTGKPGDSTQQQTGKPNPQRGNGKSQQESAGQGRGKDEASQNSPARNQPGSDAAQQDAQAKEPGQENGPGQADTNQGDASNENSPSDGASSDPAAPKSNAEQKPGSGQNPRGKPGDKTPSNRPSEGNPMGAEQGDPQNPPPSDGQPGARQPEEGQPGDKNQSEQEQPNNPQEQQPGTGKKPGGLNLNNQPPPTAPPGEQPQVDNEANLEYAKRATDLVLERLKQEQKNPADQQQLLQHLGWTPDQLDAFVKRWESLRAAAQAPGVEGQVAKRELEESLKSLGLSRRGTAMAGDRTAQDHVQGMEQSQRTEPPKKYRDSFRAFSRGIMQSKRGGK